MAEWPSNLLIAIATVLEGWFCLVIPKISKWVIVASSLMFNGYHNDMSALCLSSSRVKDWHARCRFFGMKRQRACQSLTREDVCMYTLTWWSVMHCVCGMAFQCGSTLVKVPLLQACTIVIWPQIVGRLRFHDENKNEKEISLSFSLCFCTQRNERLIASISSSTTTIPNRNPGRTQEMMMSAHKNVVLVLVVVVVEKS